MDVTLLLAGVSLPGWSQMAMVATGGLLIHLAIAKECEPVLLLPISVGCLLATLPLSALTGEEGPLTLLYRIGVANELFPLLTFLGVGAMMDFRPLLAQPVFALMGAAGQFDIFDALGANTAGQLGPVIAGGVLLSLLGAG